MSTQDYKENDVIELAEDYEYISSPNEAERDEFDTLPKGTHGTIVCIVSDQSAPGCYVEFSQIRKKHRRADPVTWVEWGQMKMYTGD